MLEPLLAEVLRDGVPGDVVEAGVYKGGVSIALAAMLHARDEHLRFLFSEPTGSVGCDLRVL